MAVTVLACLTGCALVALLVPGRPDLALPPAEPPPGPSPRDWLRRWRWLWLALAGAAMATFVGGTPGLVGAPVAAGLTWWAIERSEPGHVRRDRERARRDLPHVAGLLAGALRSGQAPVDALATVAAALPGAASARLERLVQRLRLGVHPAQVWADLTRDPALGPLGRALARAHRTGAPVATAVERLAHELAAGARGEVEDRARAVGVKAAVPLGLCLLPAFVLIGIVPVVAGLLVTLGL